MYQFDHMKAENIDSKILCPSFDIWTENFETKNRKCNQAKFFCSSSQKEEKKEINISSGFCIILLNAVFCGVWAAESFPSYFWQLF